MEDLKKAPAMRSDYCRDLTDTNLFERVDQFFPCPAPKSADDTLKNERLVRARRSGRPTLAARDKVAASANFKNDRNEELRKLEDLLLDGRYRAGIRHHGTGRASSGSAGITSEFPGRNWASRSTPRRMRWR